MQDYIIGSFRYFVEKYLKEISLISVNLSRIENYEFLILLKIQIKIVYQEKQKEYNALFMNTLSFDSLLYFSNERRQIASRRNVLFAVRRYGRELIIRSFG